MIERKECTMTRSRGRQLSLALCLGAAAFLLTSSAAADGRYTDETGDGGEAPDITEVSVTSDATGQIQFKVGVVDLPSPADVRTFLLLDTDLNPETGAPDSLGADYLFVADESDDTYWFGRWDGTDFADTPYSTVSVYSDLDRRDLLGQPQRARRYRWLQLLGANAYGRCRGRPGRHGSGARQLELHARRGGPGHPGCLRLVQAGRGAEGGQAVHGHADRPAGTG